MKRLTRRAFLGLAGAAFLGGCDAGRAAQVLPKPVKETVFDRAAPDDPVPANDEVTLCMVGDILVHQYVWKSGEQPDGSRNYDGLFEHVRDYVGSFDVAMLDQETILGGTSFEFSSFPQFNSPQEIADAEVAAGFDVMCHASNHSMDMDLAGIEADLAYWRGHFPDVVVTGIADSAESSQVIPMIEARGHKIAVLNYTSTTNGIPLPADAPWCVKMLDTADIAGDFSRARELGAEAIVACPHCGTEYADAPDGVQTTWARRFVELGADVVFCNHPHVIQPVEWQEGLGGKQVPIFWSLGNFVSAMSRSDAMVGGLGHVTLSFVGGECEVAVAGLIPLVTHKRYGAGLTTYLLRDYTDELAAQNVVRDAAGYEDFSRQWCVDFCSARLGNGFDAESCEFTLA